MESSALNGDNISLAFTTIVNEIYSRRRKAEQQEDEKEDQSIR